MLVLAAGDATVTLHPGVGGRLGQIEVRGARLLRDRDASPIGWGSYPLVPWSNRIPGGRFRFEGRELSVPVSWEDGSALHGLGVDAAWSVDGASTTAAALSLAIECGPYALGSRQRFELDATGLTQRLEVSNHGDERVPVGLGIHPWFRAGPVRVPAALRWPGRGPLPEGPPEPVAAEEDLRTARVPPLMDRCYTGLTERSADVPGLRLSWSEEVTQVVVFTGVQGWVCVEPVTMANDGFRLADEGQEGTGVVGLVPGETFGVTYRFEWT